MTVVCVPAGDASGVDRLQRAIATREQILEARNALAGRRDRINALVSSDTVSDLIAQVPTSNKNLIDSIDTPLPGTIQIDNSAMLAFLNTEPLTRIEFISPVNGYLTLIESRDTSVSYLIATNAVLLEVTLFFAVNQGAIAVPDYMLLAELREYNKGEVIISHADISPAVNVSCQIKIFGQGANNLIMPRLAFFSQAFDAAGAREAEENVALQVGDNAYGPHFKNIRPPGAPLNFPRTTTAESGKAYIQQQARVVAEFKNLTEEQANAFVATCDRVARHESGWYVNRPQNGFDIRPKLGTQEVPGSNILDAGPVDRGIFPASQYRPVSQNIVVSAYGAFQLVRDTFRAYSSRFNGQLGVSRSWATTKKWPWDVDQAFQIILPCLALHADVWAPGIQRNIPFLYLGIISYATIVGSSYGTAYFQEFDNQPAGGVELRAKAAWDSRAWLGADQNNAAKNRMIDHIVERFAYSSPDRRYGSRYTLSAHETYGSLFSLAQEYMPRLP